MNEPRRLVNGDGPEHECHCRGPPSFRDTLFRAPLGTSRNRRWLAEHTGHVQVPYLRDLNTATERYESDAILAYLDRTYGCRSNQEFGAPSMISSVIFVRRRSVSEPGASM